VRKSPLHFSGIYAIVNSTNGKVYVGQAQDIHTRMEEHHRLRNKGRLYNSVKHYGWNNFNTVILEKVDDLSLLDSKEQFWMDYFNSYDETYGYNIREVAGTTRGWHHSQETKEKIAELKRLKGISPEHQQKMQEAKKGMHFGSPKKLVQQIDKETDEVIKIWPSISAASRELGINTGWLSRCCNEKRYVKTIYGYKWKFVE
jgi:hypothetical protein